MEKATREAVVLLFGTILYGKVVGEGSDLLMIENFR